MWNRWIDRFLSRLVKTGTLDLTAPDGTTRRYGTGAPVVAVHVHTPDALRQLATNPHLALGETYMQGTLTIAGDDLHGLLELVLRNIMLGHDSAANRARQTIRDLTRGISQRNQARRARRNVAHHYDLSAALYDLFLDEDRQYSCAYFRTPDDTLEQAQAQKKAHIARKLGLEPGMRVLDIGCGWGGMALTLARDFGVDVTGVTLSEEQLKIARQRAQAAGLNDRVRFELTDYRAVTGPFDRIVSVGMFEHVGAPNFRTYFQKVHDLLTPDGVALIHTIGRFTPPGSTNPWIAKYIFPGGYIPALSETMAAIEHTGLVSTDVEVWRLHYARTLRHWHDRFMARRDEAARLYDERFVRMWKFYLVASEQTFRHAGQCVFQVQLARRQEAVPLTRDYLYAG
ncbi:MAG: class I SAM-dependent methyltransferase [Rhodobacter sp.]|uniref:cyclopropane-fatty-acyl-phospholipid synthase family protein n=1 Tax=Pararhodobacter sp. TaxID=2127056 RepID=UPI001DFBA0AD|nr:cyclopropane-fatty-acyl-phospholipid synthase family protein [Pararhodobacter sp.]MCB1344297.1 class I SAM-dependent methyltransferase [Paracoccaceae bacterium]MCC0073384.1 class I SAM-dependent methyltransferase [Rhodobacter sp.]HPD91156.1 cyclopropane-fatty-acyl-phospholipid synthase family protein [Pararhodobacter sp.]